MIFINLHLLIFTVVPEPTSLLLTSLIVISLAQLTYLYITYQIILFLKLLLNFC